MDVAAYLKQLLNQDKHVFVPGLGTFLIRKNAVTYNQQQFSPPENRVDFVAGERDDDAFVRFISAQKNISLQASGYFVEKFVDQLKTDAGTKNIPVKEALFAADEQADASFNKENFGLSAVRISTLKKELPVEEREVVQEPEPLPQKDYVENFYREFSNNLPEEETKPKNNTGFWGAIVLLLALCCLGIYALYLYYPNVFKGLLPNNQPKTTLTKTPVADTVSRVPISTQPEIIKDTIAKVVADTPVNAVKTIVPPPQKTEIDTVKTADADMVAKSPYEIIGASFKTLKGAKTFLSQLQSRGMRNAKILSNTAGKQVMITFGSFQDKASAQAALEKLRTKDSQSEAYIQHYLNK
ncbi:MAG: SPOR domain-containing protein [Sphingobacteriaceae bacterium]|nr:MAG: SPOR domain-containing protein [Sphingobacteriaceae bacterium]